MSTTVLPELAAESMATAERLVGLSGQEGLGPAEAEYILASGLAAIKRVAMLWPIVKGRIGAGTTGTTARQLVEQLLEAVEKNLSLAGMLKDRSCVVSAIQGQEAESAADLAAAQERLIEVRAEAVRLLRAVDAPTRWPAEKQLQDAKERMRHGERLTAEELRQALCGE